MEIKSVTPQQFIRIRRNLIKFLTLHGDKRITKKAIQWLKTTDPYSLSEQGNIVLCAVLDQKIKGVLAVSDYGREESFVAVHQYSRQKGIGQQLVKHLFEHMDKIYGRVALDNIPSMKMCLSIGMVGFKLTIGPTGKPTLWFGAGNWNPEDIEDYFVS